MSKVVALIVAAGRSVRFGGDRPKQYYLLGGLPVLRRTVGCFLDHPLVDLVRVVINPDDRRLYDEALDGLPVQDPVAGGNNRQESVRRGLEALAQDSPDIVLIHDGARPLVGRATIDRLIAAAESTGAAIAALPVSDTLKRENAGLIDGTVDRTGLWRAQTPQAFRFADILEAHRKAEGLNLTDDAVVMEKAGWSVHLTLGEEANIKITTAEDLVLAERLLAATLGDIRLGTGSTSMPFGPGDHVWIGGIKIPFGQTLVGHSDADVGLHAITDAILGALGAGDIGTHFPPTDEQWRGARLGPFPGPCGEPGARGRRHDRACRPDGDLRAPEDRPTPPGHGGCHCRDTGHRARAGQRQGDDDGAAGLHRPSRGHRRASRRYHPAAPLRLNRGGDIRLSGAGLLATWFGAGLLPGAPGTWGSLAALPVAALLVWTGGPSLLAVATVAIFAIGCWAAGRHAAELGVGDPGRIVIDEVAGQWLVLLVAPLRWEFYAAGFVLFRVFDVLKPLADQLGRPPHRWRHRHYAGRHHRRDIRPDSLLLWRWWFP